MKNIKQLREDLKVFERYAEMNPSLHSHCYDLALKIAALEAEAADPWREAKRDIEESRSSTFEKCQRFISYVDHLTAENARLEKRVAELEAEDATDVADAEAALAKGEFVPFEDMQPPFEGPDESFEPVLDPSRVLATAETMGWGRVLAVSEVIKPPNARPYRLKGDGE